MGFGISRHARSRKGRGLFRKAPDPKEVGDRLGRLARRMLRDAVVRSGAKGDRGEYRYIVELKMHPVAPAGTLSVQPDGEIVLKVETSTLGPGYHAHVIDKVTPILEELDYVWTDTFDPAATQAAMCAWLADELRGNDKVTIGVPDTRRFRVDAPVLTALGARDAAWRDAVLADPAKAADAFAWWQTGPGRDVLARALITMSLEVPWREPLDKGERELMTEVDEDLRAARKADPALPLPYPEWKELLMHLGIEDEDVNEKVGDRTSTLGYRRHDIEIELSGGWLVVIPGAFAGHWEDDGAKYWATDGDRMIEFSSLTANDETDSAKLLAVAPEKYEVVERLVDGNHHGRAETFEENDVPILVGLMCNAPHVGILTCKGGTREWALATWRSLQQKN
ncbi:MAG TPA: hypothetical protein VFV99_28940 [Kofleriaceae bacterium]|nr:hypothetical protein [Kofleriaceae bacterium]